MSTKSTPISITARRKPLVASAFRLPPGDYAILKRAARKNRCKISDLTRTAIADYIARFNLREV